MSLLLQQNLRTVVRANSKTISGMMDVLHSNLVANKEASEKITMGENGFLIHGFTREEAEAFALDREHYIVLNAVDEDHVVGYTIGCQVKILHPEFQAQMALVSPELSAILQNNRVLYLRHIAKLPGTKRVGTALLSELLHIAKQQHYDYVFCKIAHKPVLNKASISFHEKFGLRLLGVAEEDGHVFGVYLKALF
jgi:hypothetical protein